jgi:GxxExxY protein
MTDYHEIHEKHEKQTAQDKIVLADESYLIQGAIFEVYKTLGCGFLEAVYQECLEIEFKNKGIPFKSQADLVISYKGQNLNQAYKPDFICFKSIIIELKAVKSLTDEHRAQTLNYLKATGFKLAFLVNFGHHPKVQIERFVL